MNKPMPQINLEPIAERLASMSYTFNNPETGSTSLIVGLDVAYGIISTQGKNKGCLRASKPPMDETIITRVRYGYESRYRTSPLADCATVQIWRYVAFEASPLGQHHSMPVMASFDCPFDMPVEEMNQFSRWCQSVADVILETIPRKPGLERWANALGY